MEKNANAMPKALWHRCHPRSEVRESIEMLDTLPDLDYVLIEEGFHLKGRLSEVTLASRSDHCNIP